MIKPTWLGHCPTCNTYRTYEQANAPHEWTLDRAQARQFTNKGHALNSARYHSSHLVDGLFEDHRDVATAIEGTGRD